MRKEYICPETTVVGSFEHNFLSTRVSYEITEGGSTSENGTYQDTDDKSLEALSNGRDPFDDEVEWGNLW